MEVHVWVCVHCCASRMRTTEILLMNDEEKKARNKYTNRPTDRLATLTSGLDLLNSFYTIKITLHFFPWLLIARLQAHRCIRVCVCVWSCIRFRFSVEWSAHVCVQCFSISLRNYHTNTHPKSSTLFEYFLSSSSLLLLLLLLLLVTSCFSGWLSTMDFFIGIDCVSQHTHTNFWWWFFILTWDFFYFFWCLSLPTAN